MQKFFLHFIATTPGIYSALDRFNLELCGSLSQKGWKSVFIFLDRVEPIQIINDLKENDGIVEKLDTGRSKFNQFFQIMRLYIKYKPKKVSTHFVNYIRLYNALLSKFFEAENFNIFHSMLFNGDLQAYRADKGWLKYCLITFFLKFTIFTSRKTICISKAIYNQLYEVSGFSSKKVAVSYVGIKELQQDENCKHGIKGAYNLPSDKILIANIGAFEKLKGIEVLVKSLSSLVHEYNCKDFLVYHIGDNRRDDRESREYNRFVFSMCKDLKINNYIVFMGKRNDVHSLLPVFDIYVHPSLTEGLGSAIVEAISAGLPVVASNTGGIPEVVVHEVNGYLIEVDDSRALAIYLKELIENKEKRRTLGQNGYAHFKATFELGSSIDNMNKLYEIL